jgi:glucokinase
MSSGTAIGAAGQKKGLADSRAVFAAATNGDAAARRIVDGALQASGVAAWTILHAYLPQRIILGGGMMDEHYELFAAVFRRSIEAATQVPRGQISVAKAALGNDAGLVGGASLAFAETQTRA